MDTWDGGVKRVLKSVENKAGKKAIGVGTIIRFLAGSETEEGGWRRKSVEKKCFHTKFPPRGDMGKRCRSIRKMSWTIKVK